MLLWAATAPLCKEQFMNPESHAISSSRLAGVAKHGYFLLLIPPVLLLSLAFLLLESSLTSPTLDFTKLIRSLVTTQTDSSPQLILAEVRARYIWYSTVLVNLVVPMYTAIVCAAIIYRTHSRRRLLLVAGVGVVLCIMGPVSLLYAIETNSALYQLVFGFTFFTLQESGRFDQAFVGNVHTVMTLINTGAMIVPTIAILAFCSTVAPPETGQSPDLGYFETQMQHLKRALNAGSALLVAGVLHMDAWLRWPASLASDQSIQEAISGAALAITLFGGATFTLMLIAIYGPAASYLCTQAHKRLQQEVQAGKIHDPQQWLKEHQLSITPGEQLPQISVMLAPVIAGPVARY